MMIIKRFSSYLQACLLSLAILSSEAPALAEVDLPQRGFAGSVTEGASALLHMGARHYDPATGRFLQTDPLGIGADQLYAYAANNPYLYWDPSGLAPEGVNERTLDADLYRFTSFDSLAESVGLDPTLFEETELMGLAPMLSEESGVGAVGTFRVLRGTERARLIVYQTLLVIQTTDHGRRLINNVASRGGIAIRLCRHCGSSYFNPPYERFKELSDSIRLNTAEFLSYLETTAGRMQGNFGQSLIHELGHAGSFADDFSAHVPDDDYRGQYKMKNVILHENRVRKELGLPIRTRYRHHVPPEYRELRKQLRRQGNRDFYAGE